MIQHGWTLETYAKWKVTKSKKGNRRLQSAWFQLNECTEQASAETESRLVAVRTGGGMVVE